ncbi:helix-turn-helix domain-containing protein [Actinoplanes sp. CA-054009]
MLAEIGPALDRPMVDTVQGSTLSNLKDLGPRSGRDVPPVRSFWWPETRPGDAWVSIAEERKRLGMTHRQGAGLMGVSPGRVSQIENGELAVNGNDLRQIA